MKKTKAPTAIVDGEECHLVKDSISVDSKIFSSIEVDDFCNSYSNICRDAEFSLISQARKLGAIGGIEFKTELKIRDIDQNAISTSHYNDEYITDFSANDICWFSFCCIIKCEFFRKETAKEKKKREKQEENAIKAKIKAAEKRKKKKEEDARIKLAKEKAEYDDFIRLKKKFETSP